MSEHKVKTLKKTIKRNKTVSEQRMQLAQFILLLNKGKTREEIIESMGLNTNQFESLFQRYYDESEADQQSKTPLRIFAEVVGRKNALIRDLEDLKDALRGMKYKNAQAYVAAVKTQSDMMDSLIKLGQDLGLIVRTPEQVLLVGGKDAREMDEDELEMTILKEMQQIRGMVAKRGTTGKKRAGEVIAFPGLEAQQKSQ